MNEKIANYRFEYKRADLYSLLTFLSTVVMCLLIAGLSSRMDTLDILRTQRQDENKKHMARISTELMLLRTDMIIMRQEIKDYLKDRQPIKGVDPMPDGKNMIEVPAVVPTPKIVWDTTAGKVILQ